MSALPDNKAPNQSQKGLNERDILRPFTEAKSYYCDILFFPSSTCLFINESVTNDGNYERTIGQLLLLPYMHILRALPDTFRIHYPIMLRDIS